MSPDNKASSSSPTNYITKGILTETEQRFSSMKWFMNFLGSTIENEPEFAKFYENEIGAALIGLHVSSRGSLGMLPLLVRDIDQMLRKILMLGYYLGGRRFDRGMTTGNEQTSVEEEIFTAPTGEVSEKDFKEQDPKDDEDP